MASAVFRVTLGRDFVAGAILLKHAPIFVEVSQKTFLLEVRIFSFRGSLAENARFVSPVLQFWRKSRTKRSFWSSGFHSPFCGSLAQNARFGASDSQFSGKSRRNRSFWSSGSSVFEEVSQHLLVDKILAKVARQRS